MPIDTYQPLACELYDYLEIACLHQYDLQLELVDGSVIEARAQTTETTANKQEFLITQTTEGIVRLRLDQLARINVLTPGASFQYLDLNRDSGIDCLID